MENKRGLGRGIRALIPGGEKEVPEGPTRTVSVEKIQRNPYQPRRIFDPERLQELSESIKIHGILQPLTVRPKDGYFELIAGERRFQASKLAGLEEVPVVIRECGDQESLELALVENVQREDISALEAALAYKRLGDEFGLNQEEIAEKVGKSRSTVANTLRLLNLPTEIQESLGKGEITEGHARALLGLSDPFDMQRLWHVILEGQSSVRDTERMVREAIEERKQRKNLVPPPGVSIPVQTHKKKDPNLLEIESDLRRMLGTKVEIRQRGKKGTITVEFYSNEDLERILGLITK